MVSAIYSLRVSVFAAAHDRPSDPFLTRLQHKAKGMPQVAIPSKGKGISLHPRALESPLPCLTLLVHRLNRV